MSARAPLRMERRRPPGRLDRRTFIRRGLMAGGALVAGGLVADDLLAGSRSPARAAAAMARRDARPDAPNVLVIIVDQMRSDPARPPTGPIPPGLTANIEGLARESVQFASHYTASNDCTPARAALVTGLYTHQTGCMITGGSTLSPGFPTWGTLMREQGYRTWWFGKWHLTHGDNRWTVAKDSGALQRYGFAGGTYPSPDGSPGQGSRVDPHIATQFEDWFSRYASEGPWCTTVSFVNPHDIAWWYLWTDRVPSERTAPALYHTLPANYETPAGIAAQHKPRLQRSFQNVAAESFGPVAYTGPQALESWMPFRDLYAKLQTRVDEQVGRVLSTLASQPEVAQNTVILFTSDHGEYSAAHGMRGKGAAVYEEGIRVPLLVKDPRGVLTAQTEPVRQQLTSSVDVAPLLLSIAVGSSDWRGEARYGHIASRLDLTELLADPAAPGRPYILHATDEIVTEFATELYAADAPLHVVGVRTKEAKYATYSDWRAGTIELLLAHQEEELYDYATAAGRAEVENVASRSPMRRPMRSLFEQALAEELRQPLPSYLHAAQRQGFADYELMAKKDAREAAAQRKKKMEREGIGRTAPRLRTRAGARGRGVRSRPGHRLPPSG